MKYSVSNNIHIVEVPVSDFKIVMVDTYKKSSPKNSCNAGFFAGYKEQGEYFTLPVGHLVCDFDTTSKWAKHYCTHRGKFSGNKFTFDSGSFSYYNQFYGKSQSTFYISNGVANVAEMEHAPTNCSYAIMGVPIMRNGANVKFTTFVKSQGWDASTLYATWHIFLGIKETNAKTVYVMAAQTKTGNMITTAEMYKKFKALGFRDVVKLDGGGSFYFNAAGVTKSTTENRRINTIITFGETETTTKTDSQTKPSAPTSTTTPTKKKNPYPTPTVMVRYGSPYKNAVKWLQWELTEHGYKCGIDGAFGPETLRQIKAFQKANGLEIDGICGPLTRKALQK